MTVKALLAALTPWLGACDGVTISGGEPFDQPAALARLVQGVRNLGVGDVMLYSGYMIEALRRDHPEILECCAALVDGEFRQGDESDAVWKGSGNQRLHVLTADPAVRQRYERYAGEAVARPRVQVVGKNRTVYVIGIPRQRDAERIVHGTG